MIYQIPFWQHIVLFSTWGTAEAISLFAALFLALGISLGIMAWTVRGEVNTNAVARRARNSDEPSSDYSRYSL